MKAKHDILIVHDVPPGYTTFRVLNTADNNVGFLRWLTKDTDHLDVDEVSIAVKEHDVDYVYQPLVYNGLRIAWPDGGEIHVPAEKMRGWFAALDAKLRKSLVRSDFIARRPEVKPKP
jgi:hypothetical protein